ncbi:hypothetical protein [Myceligenerans salitolerans]|uniref:DUF4234 domain-containing protein n=1 Tax=Myceligenerans salitolerans TaxID=1230528 RepID=A0ABS3IDH7_9MICO|nr:hypothetical protein [Myceligenerans salitolerans]MBO0611034.1 hypothetical protein [Myceligenerans salitolerans]
MTTTAPSGRRHIGLYVSACAIGIVAYLVGPWIWYFGHLRPLTHDGLGAPLTGRDVAVIGVPFLLAWIVLLWAYRARRSVGAKEDGAAGLLFLGGIEIAALLLFAIATLR